MKISNVGGAKGTSGPQRKKSVSGSPGANFAQSLKDASGASETDGVIESAPMNAVDGILAVQEVPDAMDGRSKGLAMLNYGTDILDRLDEMRHAILSGTLTKDQLVNLAQKMRARQDMSDDPELNAIIQEIEMRAEIEIAKLSH